MRPTELFSAAVALAALGWGYLNQRRVKEVEGRLETVRNSHFRAADQAREGVGRLEAEVRSLKMQVRTLKSDGPLYQADMTVGEVLALDPRAGDVLGGFHIGGCSSCAVSPEDTLVHAATANGQDVEQVLVALNKLATVEGEHVAQMLERKPNVQLSL